VECLVSYLTRKSRGGFAHRDVDVSAATIRIGRGAQSEIFLHDPRVPLQCAEISAQPGGIFVASTGPIDLRVNGQVQTSARLSAGDKIAIGPYDFEVVDPPAGKELALTVELARPLGNDLEELRARSRVSLSETWLSRRRAAWVAALLVLVAFLALPLASFFTKPADQKIAFKSENVTGSVIATWDNVWLSGSISGPHLFFGANCEACHQQPFKQVRDEACLNCHRDIPEHAEQPLYHQAAGGAYAACESCHKEHNGRKAIVLNDQRFCASCHADLKAKVPQATLLDTGDFGTAHPEFRPTVVTDFAKPVFQRISLADSANLKEHSGLRFPHDKHLVTKDGGLRAPTGRRVLDCGDCHKPEPGGIGLAPINMEAHCSECHQLSFDPSNPKRALPHGQSAEAQDMVRDFYARLALEGGFMNDPTAPAVVRRRPGTPITEQDRKDALAWAQERASQTIDLAFGQAMCGYCHTVEGSQQSGWRVVPVQIVDRWMPKGVFDHAAHATTQCVDCHAAKTSSDATDVLLPKLASCQTCHGGEQATDKVPSTCVMCHKFHVDGRPTMTPHDKAAAADAHGPHRLAATTQGPAR